MGLPKRLTKMQRAYAFNIVNRKDLNQTQCAVEAGYAKKGARPRGSELQNPDQYPLVVKYIDELKEWIQNFMNRDWNSIPRAYGGVLL